MKFKKIRTIPTILYIIFLLSIQANVHAVEQGVQEAIKQQLNSVTQGRLKIGQSEIVALELLNNFYQYNDYQPAWKYPSLIDTLRGAIDESKHLGLSPDDYHRAEIKRRINNGLTQTDIQKAQLDIVLTDSLIRLSYHLIFGKVVPGTLDPDWNFKREFLTCALGKTQSG